MTQSTKVYDKNQSIPTVGHTETLTIHLEPDVVVYTMGKVGSTSISRSLRTAGLECFDVHFLEQTRLLDMLKTQLDNPHRAFISDNLFESLGTLNASTLARTNKKKIKFVYMIREPIARNISAVFQNLPRARGDDPDAVRSALQNYPVTIPDAWFRDDFNKYFGVDVFSMSFDKTSQYFTISTDAADVLILKCEADDSEKADVLSDFLGTPISITRQNASKTRWFAKLSEEFVKDPRKIDRDFIDRCLSLKFVKAFYAPSEIQAFREKYAV